MQVINPGKFEITIAGEIREVLVSLGLKTELYKLVTATQIELTNLNAKVLIDPEKSRLVKDKDKEIKTFQAIDPPNEEVIAELEEELEALYADALLDLERRQQDHINSTMLEKIQVSEESFSKMVSCLLSERNDRGVITNKLPLEVILWNQEYAEAQEELVDLVHGVVEYITAALKKISEISQMVQKINEPAEVTP